MDFARDPDHVEFRQAVRGFVDREVLPRASQIDARDEFPHELVAEIGHRGWMGMPFPESIGGAGVDYHAYADGVAELSRGSGGLGTIVAAHTSLAGAMVDRFGDAGQRERYLPGLAAGSDIGAFALSEAGAGSDVGGLETRAEPGSEGYRLSGQKQWTSNGSVADTLIVFAKTDPEAGSRGISSFVLRPKEDAGIEVIRTEDKLGDRGCPAAAIEFDDVAVPRDRRLGDEGDGFRHALETLNGGRITIAARSVGIARGALDATIQWLTDDADATPSQAARHSIATMATRLEAAELLMHAAAADRERGEQAIRSAAMAKLFASEVSREAAGTAIEILGVDGMTRERPVERHYRDAKLNEIYEGTSEILKNTIAAELMDGR